MFHPAATRHALRAACAFTVLFASACSSDDHGSGADASTTAGGSAGTASANGGASGGGSGGKASGGGLSAGNGGVSQQTGGSASGGRASGTGGASPGTGGATTGSGGRVNDAGAGGNGQGGAEPTDGGRSFSTDRTRFFGASRCAAANVQFCEDFESGDLSAWKLTGAPTIDGIQKARGQKALHLKAASGSKVAAETSKIFPETDNVYYGRAFVFFASLPTPVGATNYAHWTFIAATGDNVSGEIRLSGQMQNGINHFGVGTDNRTDANGTGDWTNSDNDPKGAPRTVPLNEWLCIEWMHNGMTNETRFYWDDTEHASLYTSSTLHGGTKTPYILPTFRRVWLGLQEYQQVANSDGGLEQYELWIDEVALDHERIGCVL